MRKAKKTDYLTRQRLQTPFWCGYNEIKEGVKPIFGKALYIRHTKRALVASQNRIPPVRFVLQDMTTYPGLALIDHFFDCMEFIIESKRASKCTTSTAIAVSLII
jgi:hypothetical protein